ncbi:MAG TPA: hypothetical protein VID47_06085 [Actinomycetota bacterium]|jgi:hypothetical protein
MIPAPLPPLEKLNVILSNVIVVGSRDLTEEFSTYSRLVRRYRARTATPEEQAAMRREIANRGSRIIELASRDVQGRRPVLIDPASTLLDERNGPASHAPSIGH